MCLPSSAGSLGPSHWPKSVILSSKNAPANLTRRHIVKVLGATAAWLQFTAPSSAQVRGRRRCWQPKRKWQTCADGQYGGGGGSTAAGGAAGGDPVGAIGL